MFKRKFEKPAKLNDEDCKRWMKVLIKRAREHGKTGEIPVVAVVLDKDGRCIGYGRNLRHKEKDPLGHAEIMALKQASLILNDWRFNSCTLIVTLEPCPMCSGALIQARVGQVIYGAIDKKRGALGGTINMANHCSSHHYMTIKRGVMQQEASKMLEEWFIEKRKINS